MYPIKPQEIAGASFGVEGVVRRRWRFSPGLRSGAAAQAAPPARPVAPAPDLLAIMLRADARHARREAWLGLSLATGLVVLAVQGWLVPVLAAGFVAAPLIGIGHEVWSRRHARG